jgi:hypothetical protein
MIQIVEPDQIHVNQVLKGLRERDRLEIEATAFDVGFSVQRCLKVEGYKRAALIDGRAVFIGGLMPVAPGCVRAWGFGTDETRKVIKAVTRHARMAISALPSAGVTRVDAVCRADVAPMGWLKSLGLVNSSPIGPMNGAEIVIQWGLYG